MGTVIDFPIEAMFRAVGEPKRSTPAEVIILPVRARPKPDLLTAVTMEMSELNLKICEGMMALWHPDGPLCMTLTGIKYIAPETDPA
jgi:hypothetical protein